MRLAESLNVGSPNGVPLAGKREVRAENIGRGVNRRLPRYHDSSREVGEIFHETNNLHEISFSLQNLKRKRRVLVNVAKPLRFSPSLERCLARFHAT